MFLLQFSEFDPFLPQIHLRQFHGTRFAAISPDMINAEELEVHASRQDSDDDQ